MSELEGKRKIKEEEDDEEEDEDEWIGPRPDEAAEEPKPKKIKGISMTAFINCVLT